MTTNIKSYGKINTFFNIVGYDNDTQYHKLETEISRTLDLFDIIEIEHCSGTDTDKVEVFNNVGQKFDEYLIKNTISKFRKEIYDFDIKFNIKLTKNIPLQAGLGGGSSNAACVVKYLFDLASESCGLDIVEINIDQFVSTIGCDCMFFFKDNDISKCTGYGSNVTEVKRKTKIHYCLIVKFYNENFCTTEMYKRYRQEMKLNKSEPYVDKKINSNEPILFNCFHSVLDFESGAMKLINDFHFTLTGSGSAAFRLFDAENDLNIFLKYLKNQFNDNEFISFVTRVRV